jgi:RNA polymerase sigma factor (sigma-70 family)
MEALKRARKEPIMPRSDESMISQWLLVLKEGDDDQAINEAVRKLWEIYFAKLVDLARHHLQYARTGIPNEEDLALSAFKSFCMRAMQGRFPRLDDRYDLWRILATIVVRKAARTHRRAYRERIFATGNQELLDEIVGREPSPELAAEVAEQLDSLLKALPSDDYRTIALKKLEGYTNAEIAKELDRTTKLVEFKLRCIRQTWSSLITEGPSSPEPP